MKNLHFNTLLLLLFFNFFINSQALAQNSATQPPPSFRVMFYNVENLFDIYDDSLKRDEEFTPDGERHWTNRKFYDKINKVYKVIAAVGEWNPPALVGMCELENRFVLEKLIDETPLKKYDYRIVHHESPDRRGIDVGLIYRPTMFELFYHKAIPVVFADDTAYKTRDILYVKGLLGGKDMLHIFINHWPSRYGGYLSTVNRRNQAAEILKQKTDSLLMANPKTAIVIMGDFNDGPEDESFAKVIGATAPDGDINLQGYYNLTLTKQESWNNGTLKYRENWDIFDQIVVSGSVLLPGPGIKATGNKATIFHAPFLLEDDNTFLDVKPFRTFTGFKYNGGYSDHLPVYIDFWIEN
ncbi:MAG: endonuclease [Bacteroidales bacterium]|nr:endonuclease [Bacteroidales bacterium]